MLGTILRRTLVWSLPLMAAYLFILSVYGPFDRPWLAWGALLIPLLGVLFEAASIHMDSLRRDGSQQDVRAAEVIGCWSGIAAGFIILFISWPRFLGGALGSLTIVCFLARRLLKSTAWGNTRPGTNNR
jgi:hypothetical protein